MYLRFTTVYTNEWNEESTGVFQALGYLIRNEEVFEFDRENLNNIRNWFNTNLERPDRFNKHSNKNKQNIAISWFKDTSKIHLKKMYELVSIFENYSLKIEIIKTENPGYKVYEDKYQIVTIPHGKDKHKVI